MPFTVNDVDKHNQGLNDAQKNRWVSVANAALKKCTDEGGPECDASAIKQANAVVKEMKEEKETVSINNVEIFKTGVWHGDEYTEKDLDDMVTSFKTKGFEAPVKLGHNAKQEQDGQPSFGWIGEVFRKGKTLFANLTDVPKKLGEAIERKQFRQVSSEIIWNFKPDMPRVLRAIALLGADIPEVKGLAPLDRAQIAFSNDFDVRYYNDNEFKPIKDVPEDNMSDEAKKELETKIATLTKKLETATLEVESGKEAKEKLATLTEEKNKLNAEVKTAKVKAFIESKENEGKIIPAIKEDLQALMESAPDTVVREFSEKVDGETKTVKLSQYDALKRVVENLPNIVEFAELGREGDEDLIAAGVTDKASAETEIERLIKLSMDKDDKLTYSVAFDKVLDSNQKLKTAYVGE